MAHWKYWQYSALMYAVIAAFVLGLCLIAGCGRSPKTAKDLGVAGLSQYELAVKVYKECRFVNHTRSVDPFTAKPMVKVLAYEAGFLNANLYGEVKRLANAEYAALHGPSTGDYDFSAGFEKCQRKLHPKGHQDIRAYDQKLLGIAQKALSAEDLEPGLRAHRIFGETDAEAEKCRQELVTRRNASDQLVAEAEGSGSELAINAAKAYQLRQYADFFVRTGTPSDDKFLGQARKFLARAAELDQAQYSNLISTDEPTRPLPR